MKAMTDGAILARLCGNVTAGRFDWRKYCTPQTGNVSSTPVLQEGNHCLLHSGQDHECRSAHGRYYNHHKESNWDGTSATPSHTFENLPATPF
jgi:hypothetical protein